MLLYLHIDFIIPELINKQGSLSKDAILSYGQGSAL